MPNVNHTWVLKCLYRVMKFIMCVLASDSQFFGVMLVALLLLC